MIGVGGEWGALGWRPPSCEGQRSIAWWRRTGAMQGVNFAEFIFQRLSEKGKRVPRSWISEGAKRPNKALWVRSRRLTVLAWASLTNLQTVSPRTWVNRACRRARAYQPSDVRDPSLSGSPLRDGAPGGDHVPHDPPAHDPPRADAEHIRGESGAERLAPARQNLGLAADLDPSRLPRVHRFQVVHEERHPWVALHIPVLLVLSEDVPADIDRVQLRVVAERDGDHMRLAVRTAGCQPPEDLTIEVFNLLVREHAHAGPPLLFTALLADMMYRIVSPDTGRKYSFQPCQAAIYGSELLRTPYIRTSENTPSRDSLERPNRPRFGV